MLPDYEDSKINRCVENTFSIWEETKGQLSTQLIFCDLSTPKSDGSFNVYDDIREKLVTKGIPKEEIVFIHEAGTETKKSRTFCKSAFRSGQGFTGFYPEIRGRYEHSCDLLSYKL